MNRFFSRIPSTTFTFVATLLLTISLAAQHASGDTTEKTNRSARFLVHLLDYLAKDYAGAVSQNGQVLSQLEYDEQVEFAETAEKVNQDLEETQAAPEIQGQLSELKKLIDTKENPATVTQLAREIQQAVISVSHLELFPNRWPDLSVGRSIFAERCVSCHGTTGAGDGPAARGLEPAPSNFRDEEYASGLAPFNAYNTIRLGVPGTAMNPFHDLSDSEIWALAFYVVSIRHDGQPAQVRESLNPLDDETLKRVATLSDHALANMLKESSEHTGYKETESEIRTAISAIRTYSLEQNQNVFLTIARTQLNEAQQKMRNGNIEGAKTAAIKAYLDGIEPIEPRIRANAPHLLEAIERTMGAVRSTIDSGVGSEGVDTSIQAAQNEIDEIARVLVKKELSPKLTFLAAFAVLLREGLEAVLIVLTLLSVVRASGSREAQTWIHGGWIMAIGIGILTWFFSGWLMQISGANREMLEGAISLFAVTVLLYVGFWLHRQSEAGRWKQFLEVRVKGLLHGRNLLGLAAISFIAVFREAFETVLFLKAIELESGPASRAGLYTGVATSFTLVFILSWLALKLSRKLPVRTLFSASSIIMLILATILTGKGMHAIQETGFLSITALPFKGIRWEFAGLYPTFETLAAQLIVLILAIALWVYGHKPSKFDSKLAV